MHDKQQMAVQPHGVADPGDRIEFLEIVLPALDAAEGHRMRLSTTIDAIFILWDAVSALSGAKGRINLVGCHPAADITITFSGCGAGIAALRSLLAETETIRRIGIAWMARPSVMRHGMDLASNATQQRDLENGLRMMSDAGAYVSSTGIPMPLPPPDARASVGP